MQLNKKKSQKINIFVITTNRSKITSYIEGYGEDRCVSFRVISTIQNSKRKLRHMTREASLIYNNSYRDSLIMSLDYTNVHKPEKKKRK